MGFLEKLFRQAKPAQAAPAPEQTVRTLKKETFIVSGTHYFEENTHKLAERNPEWKMTAKQAISAGKAGEKIYRYTFIRKPVKLIPAKKYDGRDGVNVIIAGEQVGWIRDDDTEKVLNILKNGEIKYITSHVDGGEFKIVATGGDIVKWDDGVRVRVHIGYV